MSYYTQTPQGSFTKSTGTLGTGFIGSVARGAPANVPPTSLQYPALTQQQQILQQQHLQKQQLQQQQIQQHLQQQQQLQQLYHYQQQQLHHSGEHFLELLDNPSFMDDLLTTQTTEPSPTTSVNNSLQPPHQPKSSPPQPPPTRSPVLQQQQIDNTSSGEESDDSSTKKTKKKKGQIVTVKKSGPGRYSKEEDKRNLVPFQLKPDFLSGMIDEDEDIFFDEVLEGITINSLVTMAFQYLQKRVGVADMIPRTSFAVSALHKYSLLSDKYNDAGLKATWLKTIFNRLTTAPWRYFDKGNKGYIFKKQGIKKMCTLFEEENFIDYYPQPEARYTSLNNSCKI